MYLVVLILTIFLKSPGSWSECPVLWNHYQQGKVNVCLRIFNVSSSWVNGRVICKNEKADLVQIMKNDDKKTIVKDMIDARKVNYWIGLSDYDQNDIFEYIYPTKMQMRRRRTEYASSSCGSREKGCDCMSVSKGHRRFWSLRHCKGGTNYHFICEMDLSQIAHASNQQTVCNATDCACSRKDWEYFKDRNTFIKIFKVALNFSASSEVCSFFGGRLLKVPDIATQEFVKGLPKTWTADSMFYWMGLSSVTGGEWTWIDGTLLRSKNYTNWAEDPDGRNTTNTCAAVLWSIDSKWRQIPCDTFNFFVCEATTPCRTLPVLMDANGKKFENNATVRFENNKNIQIKCELPGYTASNTKVALVCDWDLKTKQCPARKTANCTTRWIHVQKRMQGKQCTCRSVEDDGSSYEVKIHLNVVFAPYIRPGHDTHQFIVVTIGADATSHVIVVANPRPEARYLSRLGDVIDESNYVAVVTDLEDPDCYTVVVALIQVRWKDRGSYEMFVSNGIGDGMKFTFAVKVSNKNAINTQPAKIHDVGYIILAVLMFIPVIMALVTLGWKGLQDSAVYSRPNTPSYDTSTSTNSTDETDTTKFTDVDSNHRQASSVDKDDYNSVSTGYDDDDDDGDDDNDEDDSDDDDDEDDDDDSSSSDSPPILKYKIKTPRPYL